MDLTLQELFGASATQSANVLTIQKADLPYLVASANNRAEQLLVALILNAQSAFEGVLVDETGDTITDEKGESISYDNSESYDFVVKYWRQIFTQRNGYLYLNKQFVVFYYAQTN